MDRVSESSGQSRFESLYRESRLAVLAPCARRTDSSDAADACAETFLVAWRRIDDVPEPGPDGTVAYWHDGAIWTMSPDGGGKRPLPFVSSELGWNPRWSPDGAKLALLHYNRQSPYAIFETNPIHETLLPRWTLWLSTSARGRSTRSRRKCRASTTRSPGRRTGERCW